MEPILFLAALVAFSLSAVAGGGAGLLLLPLLRAALPGAQVPAALTLGTATSSVARLKAFWRHIDWRIVAWFVPASLPFVGLGAWLLSTINPLYVELLLGTFLVSNLPDLFRTAKPQTDARPLSGIALLGLGAAAGFVSGLTGAVGLLFNRFYLRSGLQKEQIVATRAANELLLHVVKLVLYGAFGLITASVLRYGAAVALAALAAAWLTRYLLPYLSEGLFKRIGYAAMVLSGVTMLNSATTRLAVAKDLSLAYAPLATGAEAKLSWRGGAAALELEYDEGFEYEREITLDELPPDKRAKAQALIRGASSYTLEEVYGIGEHSYEAYIHRDGTFTKVEF